MARILGLDPSTTCTGYCVYDDATKEVVKSGVISPNKKLLCIERIHYITKMVEAIYGLFICDKLILESPPIAGKNLDTSRKLIWLQGCLLSALVGSGMCDDYELYLPNVWRKIYGYKIHTRDYCKKYACELTGVSNHNEAEAILLSKIDSMKK